MIYVSKQNGYFCLKNSDYNVSMVINCREVHSQMLPNDAGYPLKYPNAGIKVIEKLFTMIYVS